LERRLFELKPVFVSWSGGKDSCLAAYLASQNGFKLSYLANTITEDGWRSRSHGVPSEVIRLQARALDIPLVQQPASREGYEESFTKMLRKFREEGIEDGIFGDIDFNAHKEWIDRVCAAAGVTPHLPLWEMDQGRIMRDFIGFGFRSVVVATMPEYLGEEWLGRIIDKQFLSDLKQIGGTKKVTPCGESGEYHSLVIDGPIFKQRLEILETEKVQRDGRWFLDIHKVELKEK
jgi:diphthine-ammonia ligase